MRTIKKFLASTIIIQLIFLGNFSTLSSAQASSGSQTLASQTDFQAGTTDENTDASQFPGDVRLKYQTETHTDTTDGDFRLGDIKKELLMSAVSSADGGEIVINQGWNYASATTPAIGSNNVQQSFLDSTHNLLYVSTYGGGLSVINTQGTVDPADDTLVKTYTTATTPAIASNNVQHAFLDSPHNLLYVSTNGGGLSVINTQGTIDPADDTLVKTYTTSTTPAIASNNVQQAFLDSPHNLIYVSAYGGGLSVINTQGTIDTADDTLVKTYTTSTTPAIGSNSVWYTFLDSEHNLLYVGSWSAGGLSVINTQGTIDPSDDTLVIKYSTTSTPALPNIGSYPNDINRIFFNNNTNLLYVGTDSGGLSVINTQGTVSPADDVLVKTYTTSSTPSIGDNSIRSIFLDSSDNLLYVGTYGGGISVINTQGTVDSTDDILAKTYTVSTNPAVGGKNISRFSLDSAHNLLYVGSYDGGLSAINLNDEYNNQGTYIGQNIFEEDNHWETKAVMPSALMASGSASIGNKIYIIGGINTDGESVASMFVYDTALNTWATKAPLPTQRSNILLGEIDGKLYAVGGKDTDGNATKNLYMYDPVLDEWSTKASMSQARIGHVGGVYNGKLYAVGGVSGSCGTKVPSLEEYDPNLNIWTTKTPAPAEKVGSATAQFVDGKMYVMGGQTNCTWSASNDALLIYDAETDSWITGTSVPVARPGATSALVNGKILYMGGTGNDGDTHSNIYVYEPVTDTWNSFDNLPENRHRAMAQAINGNLYVIGGATEDYYAKASTTNYFLSATYLSDTYQKELYSQLNWSATTPEGTEVELFYSLNGGNTYTSLGTQAGNHYLTNPVPSYDLTYKAVLRTDDPNITPSLDSVDISYVKQETNLYAGTSGTYLTKVIDAGRTSDWQTFTPDQTLPTGTNISYETRSGQTPTPDETWSAWQSTTDTNINSDNTRYLQFRITLTTTDENQTPSLSSLQINYDLTEEKTITEPTVEKLTEAVTDGFITIAGSDPTATESFTFTTDTALETDKAQITFPANTTATKSDGGNINLTQLTLQSLSTNIFKDARGAISIGIPNLNLTFSQPITISIPVDHDYNGKELKVYFQRNTETNWNQETTCKAQNGLCTFTTTHATTFVASYTPPKKAKLDSFSYQLFTDQSSCPQKLELTLNGHHLKKNSVVKIGNAEADSLQYSSSQKLKAIFCLQKLQNIQTDPSRTVSVQNPNTDNTKAPKKLNLSLIPDTTKLNPYTIEGIQNIQKILVKEKLLPTSGVTGLNDQATTEAVKAFQAKYNIPVTGFVGTLTVGKMGEGK